MRPAASRRCWSLAGRGGADRVRQRHHRDDRAADLRRRATTGRRERRHPDGPVGAHGDLGALPADGAAAGLELPPPGRPQRRRPLLAGLRPGRAAGDRGPARRSPATPRARPRSPATGRACDRLRAGHADHPDASRASATTSSTGGCITFVFPLTGDNRGEALALATQAVGAVSRDRPARPGARGERRPALPRPGRRGRVSHDHHRDRRRPRPAAHGRCGAGCSGPLLSLALLGAVFFWFLPQFTSIADVWTSVQSMTLARGRRSCCSRRSGTSRPTSSSWSAPCPG